MSDIALKQLYDRMRLHFDVDGFWLNQHAGLLTAFGIRGELTPMNLKFGSIAIPES